MMPFFFVSFDTFIAYVLLGDTVNHQLDVQLKIQSYELGFLG